MRVRDADRCDCIFRYFLRRQQTIRKAGKPYSTNVNEKRLLRLIAVFSRNYLFIGSRIIGLTSAFSPSLAEACSASKPNRFILIAYEMPRRENSQASSESTLRFQCTPKIRRFWSSPFSRKGSREGLCLPTVPIEPINPSVI